MNPQQPEIWARLVRFLNLDKDGIRRLILVSMVDAREFTISELHRIISERAQVSRRVVASMIGYICSRLGLLHVSRSSYRSPIVYNLREEYAELARSALALTG